MNATQVDRPDATSGAPVDRRTAEDVVAEIVTVLDRSVRALADAGQPVEASRLAARAWAVLRSAHPVQAAQLNRAMHYLARREAELEARTVEQP